MISAKATLARLNIHDTSVIGAVRDVGMMIREHASPLAQAQQLIAALSGKDRAACVYADVDLATTVAQHLAQVAVQNDTFDPDAAIADGEKHHERLCVRQPWLFAKAEAAAESGEGVAIIANSDVKVEIKADGKIKKGGREVLAAELYRIHVLEAETPVDNQGFIAILVKELGMTKPGATTYAYNCKKKFGTKPAA